MSGSPGCPLPRAAMPFHQISGALHPQGKESPLCFRENQRGCAGYLPAQDAGVPALAQTLFADAGIRPGRVGVLSGLWNPRQWLADKAWLTFFSFFLVIRGFKLRASCMRGKCSTT
jgi:hypothetical protein